MAISRTKIALMGALVVLSILSIVLWRSYSPGLETITAERLEEARSTWKSAGPADYDLTVAVEGARAATYEVRVRAGVTEYLAIDGQTLSGEQISNAWSVPGMFSTISADLANQRAGPDGRILLRGEFDPQSGYPVRYQRFDLENRHQAFWRVTAFRAADSTVP